jgi:hypothetical protein
MPNRTVLRPTDTDRHKTDKKTRVNRYCFNDICEGLNSLKGDQKGKICENTYQKYHNTIWVDFSRVPIAGIIFLIF